jgi:CelD/BcsL family acetyltransferase involved in cellulose biosynthesis
LLASGTSTGVEPLARADAADELAAAVARELGATELVRFQGIRPEWPARVAAAWRGRRPWLRVDVSFPAPYATFRDDWAATLNAKFRKNMRRLARRLEERGAAFRLAGPDDVERDLRSFAELHHARWAAKGGSGVLDGRVEAMLAEAAAGLVPADRLRIWSLDADGRTVASEIFVAAGDVVSSWLGGFDDAWAAFEPSKHLILRAIEHAFANGARRVDLGPGAQEFKLRFADGAAELQWAVLVPRGPAYLRTRARLAPGQLRRAVGDRLGPERKRAVKRLLRMGPGE